MYPIWRLVYTWTLLGGLRPLIQSSVLMDSSLVYPMRQDLNLIHLVTLWLVDLGLTLHECTIDALGHMLIWTMVFHKLLKILPFIFPKHFTWT